MEFLSTISVLIEGASKLVKLSAVRLSARRKAERELNEHLKRLATEINDEGKRIQSYLKFDNLVTQIRGAVNTILENHKVIEDDDQFWQIIEPTQKQLQDAVAVHLHNFSTENFHEFHRGQVSAATPNLASLVQESRALYNTKQRDEYLSRLQQSLPHLGQIEGFGLMILDRVRKDLTEFVGDSNAA